MSTITYRSLGPNNDPLFGQGQANFLSDADAVAQAILTRLRLFQGEWWASLNEGLPLWQSILGKSGSLSNIQEAELLIQTVILGTPYVTGITNQDISFDSTTRSFAYSATVETQFGQVQIANTPTVPPLGTIPL